MTFRRTFGILSFFVLGCATTPSHAESAPATRAEPADDGFCAWGRIHDGRGRFVRCLAEEEVARLTSTRPVRAAAPAPAPAPPAAAPAVVPAAAPTVPPPAAPPGPPPSAAASPVPPAAGQPAVAAPALPAEPSATVEIGTPVADVGSLQDPGKSLKKARDRLVECLDRNGGLAGDRGEVELRFLVAERGRAEGVSVKRSRGVTEAAAKCIANVIDRRFVGYPEQPGGVTLPVAFTKKKR